MVKFNYIAWFRGSLDNSKEGASGKKMAAFWVIMGLISPLIAIWAYWAYKHNNWTLLPDVLGSLLLFAVAALGINGVEKIADNFKNKKNEKSEPDNSPTAGT